MYSPILDPPRFYCIRCGHGYELPVVKCVHCGFNMSKNEIDKWNDIDATEAAFEHLNTEDSSNQTVKADAGKPKLTLVPHQILYDISEVREYGIKKYGDPENWKKVEKQRYRDAAFRHFLSYLRDPDGVDEESGINHLKHLACNIAFLCEMEKEEKE